MHHKKNFSSRSSRDGARVSSLTKSLSLASMSKPLLSRTSWQKAHPQFASWSNLQALHRRMSGSKTRVARPPLDDQRCSNKQDLGQLTQMMHESCGCTACGYVLQWSPLTKSASKCLFVCTYLCLSYFLSFCQHGNEWHYDHIIKRIAR